MNTCLQQFNELTLNMEANNQVYYRAFKQQNNNEHSFAAVVEELTVAYWVASIAMEVTELEGTVIGFNTRGRMDEEL